MREMTKEGERVALLLGRAEREFGEYDDDYDDQYDDVAGIGVQDGGSFEAVREWNRAKRDEVR